MDPKENILNFSDEGAPGAEESSGSNSFVNEGGDPIHPAVDDDEVESAPFVTVEELVDLLFPDDLSESEDLDDDDMFEPLPLSSFYPASKPGGME